MTIKAGINGFGRIGRNILRALYESGRTDEIRIVAINDLGDAETNAHLTRYDTAHGRFPGEIEVDGDHLVVNGDRIAVLAERDPAKLPWGELGVDVVLECTGLFASKDKAGKHLEGGAKKVIISAPGGADVDATVVYGVNHQTLTSSHTVISNASCTTNCLAPLAKAIHDRIGIEHGLMTTIHAFTNDQVLTDVFHSDLRRARSATQSMIPTDTGAAKAVGLVLPELNGKLDGFAIRVPTVNVSVVDLTFTASRETSKDEIDAAVRAASEQELKGCARVLRRAPGVDRLQSRPRVIDVRLQAHPGHRRTAGQGRRLVRQRVGLLEPDAGYHRRIDECGMMGNGAFEVAEHGKIKRRNSRNSQCHEQVGCCHAVARTSVRNGGVRCQDDRDLRLFRARRSNRGQRRRCLGGVRAGTKNVPDYHSSQA